ncbi:integral peroxisomal membrane peroxin-domain-containing protein [Lenzites betulinus]|nr:integral peroxisomal membrane peroxin-domain-containing protein [Lenzites betulinus]
MSKPSDDTVHGSPLVEFLNTLPSPLATTLIGLAPVIARTRHALQVVSWKTSWEDSWLALATWWLICLIPEFGLRYLLPPAALLAFLAIRSRPPAQQNPALVTEDTLQRAIADLTTIHALLPALPSISSVGTVPPFIALLRLFSILYVPYLLLTYLVRLRILLALTGAILLTWRSRWAAVIRRGLWRSAHIRWAIYRAWSRLSGQPLSPHALSPQTQSSSLTSLAVPQSAQGASLRFLFTIYENQRWWVGLDWTAALLPGERPSWCSASQQPAAPPSAFTLPAPTTVYTRAPDGTHRMKRTARWTWTEPEWRVVVRREGTGTSRVERPLPSAKEESAAVASASRILKAAGKMRQPSVDAGRADNVKEGDGEKAAEDGVAHADDEDAEPWTDPDGWVYADNKWEGASAKGGMGKYTRNRRWTRVAVLSETVELVEPGELGIRRDEVSDSETTSDAVAADPAPQAVTPETTAKPLPNIAQKDIPIPSHDIPGPGAAAAVIVQPAEDAGSRLRQRLKAAVNGATSHS